MDPFTMVAIIVVAAISAGAYKTHRNTRHDGQLEDMKGLKEEVQHLRERIKTLETIVTDQSYRVKSEIDGLRDR